jgi:hypothetical protein
MSAVSLREVYTELQDLKKEVTLLRHALIPEEKISKRELEELERIKKEMDHGQRKRLEDIISED